MASRVTTSPGNQGIARDLLRGAIDFHVHTSPDIIPRRQDDLELAASIRKAGMGGVVLKCHFALTADRAQIAQKLFPEVAIFGGLVLNQPACGGLNAEAVRAAIALGAKEIWLPTISAVNYIKRMGMSSSHVGNKAQAFPARSVPVIEENGQVKAELVEILQLIKDANIVLGTGHLSPMEIKAVVDAALAVGVRKILVSHPESSWINMSIEDQLELVAKGAMMERCICSVTLNPQIGASPETIARQIKIVGAESTIMATDYGQTVSPLPVDGMQGFVEQMLEHGISSEAIEMMVKVNPRRLVGKGEK